MLLFGLEGSGFIISLGLILLISGAIVFFCLRRFKFLEKSIIDQGRVLQSFIVRMQNGGGNSQSGATELAKDSALHQINQDSAARRYEP